MGDETTAMGFYKPAFFVLLAAFVGWVAFGLLRGEESGGRGGRPTARPRPMEPCEPVRGAGGDGVAARADRELDALRAKLTACERARGSALRDAVDPARAMRDAASGVSSATDGTDYDQQQKILCELAVNALREQWRRDADGLVEALGVVGTGPWVEDWTAKRLELEDELFDLTPQDRSALENGYRTLWGEHGPKIQQLLGEPEVDAAALVAEVRATWAQEDDLIDGLLGPEALEQYRGSELLPRTAMLAILATLAGVPYDRSLAW